LSDVEQLIAHTVLIAVQVAGQFPAYEVTLPSDRVSRRILRSAGLEAGPSLTGSNRLTRRVKEVGPTARIHVGEAVWVEGTTPREARVPFAYGVGEGEAVDCVVRIRLSGTNPTTWHYQPEGDENCWPRPSPRPAPAGDGRVPISLAAISSETLRGCGEDDLDKVLKDGFARAKRFRIVPTGQQASATIEIVECSRVEQRARR
jgi:hypothetical protein